MQTETNIKIVTLGKEATGKTALVERFLNDEYHGHTVHQATIAGSFGSKTLDIDGREVKLGVWDTAGSERYDTITRMYYRDAKAAVLCYAVDEKASWDRLKHWVEELNKAEPRCQVYVCATKIDLLYGANQELDDSKRAVQFSKTQEYCQKIGANLVETSSLLNKGVSELFEQIARDYIEKNVANEHQEADSEELNLLKRGRHAFARA